MDRQLEIEFKVLINQEIYHTILKEYQSFNSKTYIQTNHYLTHPVLEKLKYMLRIREKEGSYELTLKQKAKIGNIETNIPITKEIKDKIFSHEVVENEIFSILKKYNIDMTTLENPYSLTTTRSDIMLPTGLLSIDKNQYLNKEDYEIEFEVTDYTKGKEAFLALIKPYNITYTKNCDSKIKRVKQAL